jgi:beta-glucosidase
MTKHQRDAGYPLGVTSFALIPRRTAGLAALLLAVAGIAAVPSSTASAASCPWVGSSASPSVRAAQVLSKMSLTQKVQFVGGTQTNGPSAGLVKGIPALCVPNLVLNDASAGLGNKQTGTTAFPDEIAQAATWDVSQQAAQGRAIGLEAVAKGVNVVLGPGANLARNPLNGRGFEYAGEDPLLTGRTVTALAQGIQSEHVIATVKHVALNEQETQRDQVSSDVSERVAAELYLAPFEAAVKGGVGAAMCGYNRVNGTYACQDSALLRGVLKGRFGFGGFVMSDFPATHSTSAANAGLDLELPVAKFYGGYLLKAVQSGAVSGATLNDMVRRILTSMFRVGLFDHPPRTPSSRATTTTSLAVSKRIAQQGSVLLKNTAGVLPLADANQRIAVIGDAASNAGAQRAIQGYGSAHVPQFALHDEVADPYASLQARVAKAGGTTTYNDGSNQNQAVLQAALADVAIVFVNDVNIEGLDRPDLKPRSGSCDLNGGTACTYSSVDQDALVSAVAAANPHTIVVLQTGGPVEMPWASSVEGIVENWLPGQIDGPALEGLLWGDVNFTGKLPVTFPVKLSDGPLKSASQYPGVTDSKGIPRATYSEGLLIGYRWYDAKKVKPLFPFGYGLSYTSYSYSRLRLVPTATGLTAQVTVTNTGSRAGAETVQVYASAPASAGEPPKALAGFVKTSFAPGQTKVVSVPVSSRAFQVWSSSRHTWSNVVGCYVLRAGGGSTSLPLIAKLPRNGGRC